MGTRHLIAAKIDGAYKLARGGKTNADRLRAKSDEELVDFLYNLGCPGHDTLCPGKDCRECWADWLGKEASDGG